jgi:hypothetical protein
MVWVVPMARAMLIGAGWYWGDATLPASIKRAFATRITTPHTRRSCALRLAPNAIAPARRMFEIVAAYAQSSFAPTK